MASARNAEQAFFPLDEELELLDGRLSPTLHEQLVRLSSWMPFKQAGRLLADFMRLAPLPESLARRYSEAAGEAYVQLQTETVEQLERETPLPTEAPERMVMEVDGALVALDSGEWAEARTLILGTVGAALTVKGETQWPLRAISSFSRLCDHQTFARLALVETQRRGLERAGQVAALADGAEWIQGFTDHHRPKAVRILDFAHAAEHLTIIGASVHGEHTAGLKAWLVEPCRRLKHEGAQALLPALHAWSDAQPPSDSRQAALAYLDKRLPQMDYPGFHAQGWPIGSGAVESANKVVVEARLKGSGMRWARAHVNPMLALRNMVCSDRWAEDWPQLAEALRAQARRKRAARHQPPAPSPRPLPPKLVIAKPAPGESSAPTDPTPASDDPSQPYRPAPDHPWRKFALNRQRFKPAKPAATKS